MEDPKDSNAGNEGRVMFNPEPKLSAVPEKDWKHTAEFNGWWYAEADVEEARRRFEVGQAEYRKRLRKDWAESPWGKLCLELYEKFMAYKKFLEEHPYVAGARHGQEVEYPEHRLFSETLVQVSAYTKSREEKDRKNLERAHLAARCQHTHLDGRRCGAARVRGQKLCRMHLHLEEMQAMKVDLGSMEDPDSIQLAIMKLQRALLDGTLEAGQVRGLSYLVQLAAWNVTRTSAGRPPASP
ncbi:MAG TPA: hypothetical protein VKW06_01875 [Candidatus Angelobacter sp.]|nr:hypothetical protein [Candidatus Angelobacter sp.]